MWYYRYIYRGYTQGTIKRFHYFYEWDKKIKINIRDLLICQYIITGVKNVILFCFTSLKFRPVLLYQWTIMFGIPYKEGLSHTENLFK